MVTVTCDSCGVESLPNVEKHKNKRPWIQGYHFIVGSPRTSNSIRLLERWDESRIAEFGAVHFCSAGCKDKYLMRQKAA
jgi:hypothetical protein